MIRLRRLLVAAACLLLLADLRAEPPQAASPMQPPRAGFSFPARQTLNYSVDWRVFPAGVVSFHVEADGEMQRVTVTADTVGAVNLIFRVSDRFQSSFQRSTGCSESFSKQLIEGRRQVNSDLHFNYAQSKAMQTEKNLISGISKHQEAAIPSCVTDSLSAIFYAASQPMTIGQSFQMPLADAMKTIPVTMKVEGREEVKTPAGAFQTLRVEPTADAGIVKNRGNIWIWYTDDDRHMPVQMRARLFWGTITFRLTSVEQK
ncbi:hypothetical protein HNQ77_005061 [Silvibacterium bohemicum]|uniref:DUF3108 domain-containing protein n=1 Tax=Silvibacterium bohemicum TaxID=1577686 RepID=A0A841K0J9_9BACT|nr:DUF3108 domain-containing protein [Silvibacterium bohemicum]MBB6147076.1 hypothetical protein [Silvibacterium bohemicum]